RRAQSRLGRARHPLLHAAAGRTRRSAYLGAGGKDTGSLEARLKWYPRKSNPGAPPALATRLPRWQSTREAPARFAVRTAFRREEGGRREHDPRILAPGERSGVCGLPTGLAAGLCGRIEFGRGGVP